MKKYILLAIVFCVSFNSIAQQRKGFYFNISANVVSDAKLSPGASGNIGYCFGWNTLSIYSYVGQRISDAIAIEHNANFKVSNKISVQSVVALSFVSGSTKVNELKCTKTEWANGRAIILGVVGKYYYSRRYAITANARVHFIHSAKEGYPIQDPQDLSPFTFGIGFGR